MLITMCSGCASMFHEECKIADWYKIGYENGLNGSAPSIIDGYTQDCNEAEEALNRALWNEGFDKGIGLYCSPENGYTVGSKGKEYYGVCCNKLFLDNYRLGSQIYQRQQRIQQINTKILIIDNQLANPDKENTHRLKEKRKRLAGELSLLLTPTNNSI
ncbi:hypothetical protein AND4_10879 [Vibrio sp. AND4]|nr:hypothetical protein AND4_10879 [Vibrio sp. AND4]